MTIVYSYHCEPAEEEDELALVHQLQFAARYRRGLAQSENLARALWRSWSSRVTAHARASMAAIRKDEALDERVTEALDEVIAQSIDPAVDLVVRSKMAALGLDSEVLARLLERRRIASAQSSHDTASRGSYADAGLSWGTYQHVEEAHAAACRATLRGQDVWLPPPLPVGCVAVHLQPARLLRGESDAWIRIGDRLVVRRGWQRIGNRFVRRTGDLDLSGRTRPARHREVYLRIGTLPDRSPRFVKVLVLLDRELPPDARVSWAMVARRRVADAHRWELKIVFDAPSLARPASTSAHAAGVDVGWRQLEGRVRVAVWWGTDGRFGEVCISDRVLGADDKSDSLRAIRDRCRDALRARLVAWASGRDLTGTWIAEALVGLPQWQRYARFARLARFWPRDPRYPKEIEGAEGVGGPHDPRESMPHGGWDDFIAMWRVLGSAEEIRAELAAWVAKNRHLWRWEAFGRRKRGIRVAEVIRQFAVRLSREYGRIGLEKPFVGRLVRRSEDGRCEACRTLPRRCAACSERERLRRLASTRVPHAAPARTREELRRFGRKYGALVVERDPAYTTRDCAATPDGDPDGAPCGFRRDESMDWSELVVGCPSCGTCEDQDLTAAKNLARFARDVVLDEDGRPILPDETPQKGRRAMGPRRTRRARARRESP